MPWVERVLIFYLFVYPKSTQYTQTESASAQKSSWELVPFTYILQHTDSVRQPANDIYNNMSISNNGFHHPVCSKYVTMYICSRISVHLEQIHVIHITKKKIMS